VRARCDAAGDNGKHHGLKAPDMKRPHSSRRMPRGPSRPQWETACLTLIFFGACFGGAAGSIHRAWRENPCVTCHPTDEKPKPPESLCLSCHDRERYLPSENSHPGIEGSCLACHHGHQSPHPSLLRGEPIEFCYRCHADQKRGRTHPMGMRDPLTGSTLTCISSCHQLHNAPFRYFLRKDRGRALCVSCHGDNVP
jgi:predicted CXXCH cytochrome family protein